FAAALCIGNQLARDRGRDIFIIFASLLLFAATISVWLALRQWLTLPGSIWVVDLPPGGRPFANLAQPNNLATLIFIGLCGLMYLWHQRLLGNWSSGLLAVVLMFGVALTQSRTPWVISLILLIWWLWRARKTELRL